MEKDSNIRITKNARKLLRKIAKKEGRTLKMMFELILHFYKEKRIEQ